MSETQFDRASWRPGKRRRTQPRQRDFGGQKQAPVAFLAKAKFCGLNTNAAARCTATARSTGLTCRRVALKGTGLCQLHGGALHVRKLRPYTATRHGQRIMAERALGVFSSDRRRQFGKRLVSFDQ
jgi:hypothetical protein